MTNDTTNGQTSYYAKDPCECGGRIVVTGKKQTCERCSVMTPKKCGECGNEIWWPKDQDDPICEHCDKPATTNSELDLATLEKACPEAYNMLAKFTNIKELSKYTIDPNGNLSDGEVTLSENNANAIAARMVELYQLATKQAADLVSLTDAFHDAINRPKGVVPKSGDRFYDQDRE